MLMLTELSCVFTQPTLLCAPLAFSCTFFFALYGPPFDSARIQAASCSPQSLNGTLSRPAVQSMRGSTVMVAVFAPSSSASLAFHEPGEVTINGRPAASVRNEFIMFCDGWWKPQQPNGLPECGKLSRSP